MKITFYKGPKAKKALTLLQNYFGIRNNWMVAKIIVINALIFISLKALLFTKIPSNPKDPLEQELSIQMKSPLSQIETSLRKLWKDEDSAEY